MKKEKLAHWALALAVLLVFMGLVTAKMHGFKLMPGDVGDGRLNNYFLENVWQFFRGNSDSLIHLGFFFPYPYVLGLSDNLWGSAPVYLLGRLFGADPHRAFQIWYYVGYVANFAAALWALRRLKFSIFASLIGAVFFAFNLPEICQMGHAQLHWRAATPIALYFAYAFLCERDFKAVVPCALWTVAQFWLGIYNGVFLLLILLVMGVITVVGWYRKGELSDVLCNVLEAVRRHWRYFTLGLGAAALFMGILFYPYIAVKLVYGYSRSYDELKNMLPGVYSYFLMDGSSFYGGLSQRIAQGIPLRWEHQIFIGVSSLLMLIAGIVLAVKSKPGKAVGLFLASLAGVFLITLHFGYGWSLYYPISKISLFGSTRAMSRVIFIMIFPMAILMAFLFESVYKKNKQNQNTATDNRRARRDGARDRCPAVSDQSQRRLGQGACQSGGNDPGCQARRSGCLCANPRRVGTHHRNECDVGIALARG